MDSRLVDLGRKYRRSSSRDEMISNLRGTRRAMIRRDEFALFDCIALVLGISDSAIGAQHVSSSLTPQMEEAFHLAFPQSSLAELDNASGDTLRGFLNGWKGKYFEVLVRDKLNAGERLGDLRLDHGQTAELASDVTQPGWDLRVVDAHGHVVDHLQMKATSSLAYVKDAIQAHPDIKVISTDEIAHGSGAFPSGVTNAELDTNLLHAHDSMHGHLHAALDSFDALPFVMIVATEGYRCLVGRKSLELALQDGLTRSVASLSAMGAVAVVHFLDGGLISIPVAIIVRLGVGSFLSQIRSNHQYTEVFRTRVTQLKPLLSAYATTNR